MTPMPSPQQNQNVAPQQTTPINQDVMELVSQKGQSKASPEVEQAKQRLLKVIQTAKLNPQELINAGKYAKEALRKPEMYPMAVQMALKQKLITPDMVKQSGVDYELLSIGITVGKLTEDLKKEGKL